MLLVATFEGAGGVRERRLSCTVHGEEQLRCGMESIAEQLGERVKFERLLTQGEAAAERREMREMVREMELALAMR